MFKAENQLLCMHKKKEQNALLTQGMKWDYQNRCNIHKNVQSRKQNQGFTAHAD